MSCDKWRELIIDRLADELGEEDAVLLEQHLADCADCTKEEQRLSLLLHATVPREEWPENHVMENRLTEMLRQINGPCETEPTGNERNKETKALPLYRRILPRLLPKARQKSQRLSTYFRRPVPTYAVLSLVLVAVTAGFWIGHASAPDWSAEMTREPVLLTPSDPAFRGDESFADAALAFWPMDSVTHFSRTPTDAISLAVAFQPDSL